MNNSVCYMQKCKAAEFAVYVVPVNGTFCRNLGFQDWPIRVVSQYIVLS